MLVIVLYVPEFGEVEKVFGTFASVDKAYEFVESKRSEWNAMYPETWSFSVWNLNPS